MYYAILTSNNHAISLFIKFSEGICKKLASILVYFSYLIVREFSKYFKKLLIKLSC